jgi:uncharacterized membrane protein
MSDMTVIVLLLIVWIAGCLMVAGLLWALAAARSFAQAGQELAHWLRDHRTARWIRLAVAVLVLGPTAYLLIAAILVTADVLALVVG